MSLADEGFRNEGLRGALEQAIAGKPQRLEDTLARLGAMPSPKPNLKLAVAFGVEMAGRRGAMAGLLSRLAACDAPAERADVFLPMVAAFGWTGRLRAGHEIEAAWEGLRALCADHRAPVRQATLAALQAFGNRPGGPDEIIARASTWLEAEDREERFGATAVVVETLGDVTLLAAVRDRQALRSYLSAVIALVADAPRAAERSDGRRRVLLGLPRTLAAVVAAHESGQAGQRWLQDECTAATHPAVREALSRTIASLSTSSSGKGVSVSGNVGEALRTTLQASAKPLRDPSRVRPGTARGRRSRPIR